MKRLPNACKIRVTYPDGCRHIETLDAYSIPALNILPFIQWLRDLADEIEDRVERDGRCGTTRKTRKLKN